MRVLEINRAVSMLSYWATSFPDRKPEHYVFLSEKVGLDGEDGFLKSAVIPYETNPEKPMGSWKTAWNGARKTAAIILAGSPENTADIQPLAFRSHDARHTAISRMIDAGVPLPKIAKIVGWSPSTMVRMAARYGHFGLDELRGAVESISRTAISAGSPVFSPVLSDQAEAENPKLLS